MASSNQEKAKLQLFEATSTWDILRSENSSGSSRPPTRLPAATPMTYDFDVVVGLDILFIHGTNNRSEHPVLNITCWGTLYSTCGLVDLGPQEEDS